MTEFKPDFAKAYNIATDTLLCSNCFSSFPYPIKDLIKEQSDIFCCSYKKALNLKVPVEDFGSDSASILEYEGRNIIFYNQDNPKTRIRFSIAHEFGHYLLLHKKGLNPNDKLYIKQEIETNFFSAQLLMPEQLLDYFRKNLIRIDTSFLTKNFGVSKEAAQKRIETLKSKIKHENYKNFNKDFDESIIKKYKDFLDSVISEFYKNNNKDDYDFEEEYSKQKERNNWY